MSKPDEPFSGRTVILCFDGTNNTPSSVTNVGLVADALLKNEVSKQTVQYYTGIGTEDISPSEWQAVTWLKNVSDMGVAWSLGQKVVNAYCFIAGSTKPGDRVCMFGFSRGAYTARVLAAFIHRIGVRPSRASDPAEVKGLWQEYEGYYTAKESGDEATYRKTRQRLEYAKGEAGCRSLNIHFMGVWDTVSSVGYFRVHRLPGTYANENVDNLYHAVSLDERRVKFGKNLVSQEKSNNPKSPSKNFNEVWFAGCHTDVGGPGGRTKYWSDAPEACLANIPLQWMLLHAMQHGLQFDQDKIGPFLALYPDIARPGAFLDHRNQNDQSPFSIATDSVDTAQVAAEPRLKQYRADFAAPMHDKLVLQWGWWALEFLNFERTYPVVNADGKVTWHSSSLPHHAAFRVLRPLKPIREGYEALPTEIHASVLYRYLALGKQGYPANTNLFGDNGPRHLSFLSWVTTVIGCFI